MFLSSRGRGPLIYTAAILWNSLPAETRLSPAIDNFQNIINNYVI